jgi:putative acetyltransferase
VSAPDSRSITIRRPRLDDAAAIAATMNDPSVLAALLQMPHATEAAWRKRIEEMPAGASSSELFLVAELGGRVVGNAGVHPYPHVRRHHAASLGLAVARDAQRQGVGNALMAALIDWADRWAGLLRLELTVYTDNAPAIALYRKFGFVLEGTHRAYALRDGVYVDAHAMARLHPRPPLPASA